MDAVRYREHDCPAYRKSEYRNPLEHKLGVAQWKIPGVNVELSARGSVLTGDDVQQFLSSARVRGPSIWSRFIFWLRRL